MTIEKEFFELFVKFLKTRRGLTLKIKEKNGEYGRCMLGDNLLIVRDMENPCDVVEVFCSNKDQMKLLEQDWLMYFSAVKSIALQENDDVQESIDPTRS